jgi:hypothetical protein
MTMPRPNTAHYPHILAAADIAKVSGPALALPTVDQAAVDRVIAHLPDAARAGRREDPAAAWFSLGALPPRDRNASVLYAAVAEQLKALGLDVYARTAEHIDGSAVPIEYSVSYESLLGAATYVHATRTAWIDAATSTWVDFVGPGGKVVIEPGSFGPVAAFLSPTPSPEDAAWIAEAGTGARSEATPGWRSGTDFYDHPPIDLARAAIGELRIPRWTFDDVAKLWSEGTGGTVTRSHNLYTPDGVRHGRTLIFVLGDQDKTYAFDDVYTLTAEALVDEVLRDGPWATAPMATGERPRTPSAHDHLADRLKEAGAVLHMGDGPPVVLPPPVTPVSTAQPPPKVPTSTPTPGPAKPKGAK